MPASSKAPPARTFFNHYILFPHAAPRPKANKVGSVLIGICTLGFVHLGCALVYGAKKLRGRASKPAPKLSHKVALAAASALPAPAPPASLTTPPLLPPKATPPCRSPITRFSAQQVRLLSEADIKGMTADQQGYLMDNYAEIGGAYTLTQAQLRGMVGSKQPGAVKIVNVQETGKGHCGRYAINNARQKDELSTDQFLHIVASFWAEKMGCTLADAKALAQDDDAFGVGVADIRNILQQHFKQPMKESVIAELAGCEASKQKAMQNFLGNAEWAILAQMDHPHPYAMPSPTVAPYTFTSGHLAALRKDAQNRWWYIDSRNSQPVNIALAAIPRSCTLLVPTA